MKTRSKLRLLCVCMGVVASITVASAAAASADFRCTPPQLWASGLGERPETPFVADVDGDGYGDLVCCQPGDRCVITVSLNGYGEKPVAPVEAGRCPGGKCVGAAGGRFTGGKAAGALVVLADGSLRLMRDFEPKEARFTRDDLLGKLPVPLKSPVFVASGDTDGDGACEAVITDGTGRLWLVDVADGAPETATIRQVGRLTGGVTALCLGDLDGTGKAIVLYEDKDGNVTRCGLGEKGLGRPTRLMKAKPGVSLVAAHLNDDNRDDLVVGTTVLWGGDPKNTSQWKELADSEPGILVAGRIRGDDRDDLVRFRRLTERDEKTPPGHEPYTKDDIFVHFTYKDGDPDPANSGLTIEEKKRLGLDPLKRDTSGDGLLDGWKVKGARGMDLPGLGCSPVKKNIICEITPIGLTDAEVEELRSKFRQVREFYADLPIANPDGTLGVNFIPILLPTVPEEKYGPRSWRENGSEFLAKNHHGVSHWMQVVRGGGGQSAQMGDMGGCGNMGFPEVFIHEFGHQLGLDHSGFWADWSPTYPSLMNYSYNYSFNGARSVHYSKGIFKDLVLRQNDLSEVLPYRLKYVDFLGNSPSLFKLKADGDKTLIDWNRNGIFGEEHVRACVTDGYGLWAGDPQVLDKTIFAPALVSYKDKELLLFFGKETTAADGSKKVALIFRSYKGDHQWNEPVEIEPEGLTGDPLACAGEKSIEVFYPTEQGVLHRQFVLGKGKWIVGKLETIPDSVGAQITPRYYKGRLYAFIWSGEGKDVAFRMKTGDGWSEPKSLGFASNFAVGAVVDTIKDDLILGGSQDLGKRKNRWQIRRFAGSSDGNLTQIEMRWIEGEKGRSSGEFRPTLIFETGKDAGPEGRIHYIGGGTRNGEGTAGTWGARQIVDRSYYDGWKVPRYYNEWANTRSCSTAAWFQDNIIFAYRWPCDSRVYMDNDILVGYNGLGINPEPIGDFDDVDFIADTGIGHSILYFATKEGR
ncbi:MAG: hypothetical protein M1133_05835 [Armatimonadetes bacterium]|nr:hypothetical protein [Armatimonadota bacterium]